ncbi:dimethyl sulfoxide reductase anchor subunit [Lysobacter sp. BMK333-48F3]|uniref:dimethyl sulfoxide reductase anchor subunit family protein n=1 Tax=Lysobacter sp. BMK333-48F3 TaxID=2867962 RepID=UPI001C8BFD6A|nr:DmsC/YnfH family molybdoenzyme membrane anchor subunit [Lysobacter sp. BMK333-48F3]MBX9400409.1 dimethyl sulfoxide reductase anchor subunit [Lysobacter sp. BMK333-48F3]
MHPAFSVIFFTTLSGAGYGLLTWLSALLFWRSLSGDQATSLPSSSLAWGLALALLLVSVGLLSSTLHLGKPGRAWRAFSQWRSSWLSREGLLAVATYLPALGLGLWLIGPLRGAGAWLPAALAAATAVLALLTVACTAMIYASLPPIPAWRHRLVVPGYLLFALLGGAALLAALPGVAGQARWAWAAPALLAPLAALLKLAYWRAIDRQPLPVDRGDALGLPGREATVFERPHTEANYLTREMGYVLARKHAAKLRGIAVALFALAPLLAAVLACWLPAGPAAALAAVAALAVLLGTLVERWLFFAQARHVVTLYY